MKSSEQSIQEIADELHFANQSFFGKYFKQYVGVSPKEFREEAKRKHIIPAQQQD